MCEAIEGIRNDARMQGRQEVKREMVLSFANMGFPFDKIAEAAKVSVETIQEWIKESGN